MIEFSQDAFVMPPAEHQVRGVKTLLKKKAYAYRVAIGVYPKEQSKY